MKIATACGNILKEKKSKYFRWQTLTYSFTAFTLHHILTCCRCQRWKASKSFGVCSSAWFQQCFISTSTDSNSARFSVSTNKKICFQALICMVSGATTMEVVACSIVRVHVAQLSEALTQKKTQAVVFLCSWATLPALLQSATFRVHGTQNKLPKSPREQIAKQVLYMQQPQMCVPEPGWWQESEVGGNKAVPESRGHNICEFILSSRQLAFKLATKAD